MGSSDTTPDIIATDPPTSANTSAMTTTTATVTQAPGEPTNITLSTETKELPDIGKEYWFGKYWRPLAAYVYLAICLFDFMLAPIFLGYFSWMTKAAYIPWVPLTIQGGSIFHLSFGAIIGVYAWGRTKEKISGVADS